MNADLKAVGSASVAASTSPSAPDAPARAFLSLSATKEPLALASPLAQPAKASSAVPAAAPKVIAVQTGGVLQFSVEPATSQLVIKVVDGTTSEVIRKIPSDQVEEIVSQVRGVPGLILNKTS